MNEPKPFWKLWEIFLFYEMKLSLSEANLNYIVFIHLLKYSANLNEIKNSECFKTSKIKSWIFGFLFENGKLIFNHYKPICKGFESPFQ